MGCKGRELVDSEKGEVRIRLDSNWKRVGEARILYIEIKRDFDSNVETGERES